MLVSSRSSSWPTQRERRLRARRLRQVVRNGGPERHSRYVEPGARVLQHADDPGRSLVGGRLQLEPVLEVELGGRAADLDRPGVRRLGQQGAEGHHQLDTELVGAGEQLGAELAPLHVRLDAAQEHHVPVRAGRPGDVHLRRGPGDPAHPVLAGADQRTVHLEVVELLGVDHGHDLRAPHLDEVVDHPGGGTGSVVPALERRHHHRVDEMGHVVDLDHEATLGPRTQPRGRSGRDHGRPLSRARAGSPCENGPARPQALRSLVVRRQTGVPLEQCQRHRASLDSSARTPARP